MKEFLWYEEINNSSDITQGDIFLNCHIPLPDKDLYKAIIQKEESLKSKLNLQIVDVIILSQACDIENDKINSLVMCPIWSLSTLMKENKYYKSSKARENLRQGKEPAYHLLNDYSSPKITFEFSVVEFHRIYSLPKNYLKTMGKNEDVRLRLLPPYREHLSQAFARYFMRVGLPIDIEKSRIRNIDTQPA